MVHNGAGIVMPTNEPAPGRRKSQIDEYLDAYRGPGVQHIALATPDIVTAVAALQTRGVRFLQMPAGLLRGGPGPGHRVSICRGPISSGSRSRWTSTRGGYLLQIFTETMADRPTLFLEIIQREGATGFGEGNFKALFEAIEREQARRGNL